MLIEIISMEKIVLFEKCESDCNFSQIYDEIFVEC